MSNQINMKKADPRRYAEPNKRKMHRSRKLLLTITFLLICCTAWAQDNPRQIKVEGKAMEPTLNDGDIILINERVEKIERGDIVIFWYPGDPSKSFINRIIAVGGEVIRMDKRGQLFIDGHPIDEPYISKDRNLNPRVIPETYVRPHYYFVMVIIEMYQMTVGVGGLSLRNTYGKYIRRHKTVS